MKPLFSTLLFFSILAIGFGQRDSNPRVFIFTDINIDSGDPDDRQSLIHLFWYADELQIEGVVPDRWNAQGYEACQFVLEAYEKDFSSYGFKKKGFPKTKRLARKIAKDTSQAADLFYKAAAKKDSPLYVLVWGNMRLFKILLLERPELAKNIRLLTIGTGLMLEKDIPYMPPSWKKSPPCQQLNWNGFGRNEIYNDSRFNDLWWVEMNWTYAGMFPGEEPKEMFQQLSQFGSLGKHIKEVVKNEDWAQYFRVGDTPSVLYLLDQAHDPDDPTESNWAGQFVKPFPEEKPNYYTDFSGAINWDYVDPCKTWDQHLEVQKTATGTLENRRKEMYTALLHKLQKIYEN
ncbi:MAG: nucleoside hydrolase-like domain-containing protein [Bacteroidota bacterium]